MNNHRVFINGTRLLLLGSIVVVALLCGALYLQQRRPAAQAGTSPLIVYCAAGLKAPIEAVARAYEQETGASIQFQYGGSGTLLSNIRVTKSGDLYIAADESYITTAKQDGLLAETIPLARQHPVIVVQKGNPKAISSIDDLLRPEVSFALANPDAASVGKLTKNLLEQSGQWAAIQAKVKVLKPTVNDVANDVKIGSVDASIVWDTTAAQYVELEAISTPAFDQAVETITLGVLTASKQPTAALRFARYLSARDRGLLELKKRSFNPVDGDTWAGTPEINLYSGAMLRPAIEQTLQDFEQREGVRITTVYNGCGILTAQMRAGATPDACFSCDTSFMKTVAHMYLQPVKVASNDLVILTAKGNPQNIATADLAKPGLRLGLAHPEKSAMGALTKSLLEAQGIYPAVSANLKMDSPTGDFLVNQLRTGSLDAIIACRSNAVNAADFPHDDPIAHPLALAVQPYAVSRRTAMPRLMARLRDAIESPESRHRFEAAGFHWAAQ